jgi:predicted nucleic-acid-binding protein
MKGERIFADTNLFLRLLTNDVPGQVDAFVDLLKKAGGGEFQFVINPLVIAEIVWTLESYYQQPKSSIQSQILAILNTPGLEVADSDLVLQAIHWYVEKNVDFIDAFNAAWMQGQGITSVCTFDEKHFKRFEGIQTQVPV